MSDPDADEGELSKPCQFDDGAADDETDYDVIICGTDLVQSILSSALSRAGMKVLHCDGAEWYGGFDAVLYGGTTLELFLEGCEAPVDCPDEGVDGIDVANLVKFLPKERHGDLKLHGLTQTTVDREAQDKSDSEVPSVHEPKQVDDLPTQGDVCGGQNLDETPPTQSTANTEQPCGSQTGAQQKTPLDMNGFCFDISPSLIYASGDAVGCLIKSGVSDYLEFKSLKGLHLLIEEDVKKSRAKRRTDEPSMDHRSRDDSKLACYRVPCSKGDVFKSKLLSPVDKRRLMKFLQLITDYGAAQQIEEIEAKGEERSNHDNSGHTDEEEGTDDVVKSVNERYLHQGRALSRPQNKAAPSSGDLDSLMSCIQDSTSFSEFLSKVAKLPERLAKVVMYALSLAPGNIDTASTRESGSTYTTKDGVDDLVAHMTALGRFGDTAFLVTMYGSGELSQAFCRSGAVYGSTYMLRRSPLAVLTDDSKVVKGIVLSGEEHIGDANDISTDDVIDKSISCKHVIVPSTMLPQSVAHERQARIYRRVCILRGKLIRDDSGDDEQRHAVVIPPHTTSVDNMSAIHGVVVDESAFVAPSGKDCTLVHLTTSKQEGDATPDEAFVGSLERAYQMLVSSQQIEDDENPIEEIRHISFSYSTGGELSRCLSGLHVCRREGQSLTSDYAFAQAREIFGTICPNSDFLGLSKKVEEAIVYRDKEDSDDEQGVLESAVDMLRPKVEEDGEGAGDEETERGEGERPNSPK